VNALPRRLGFYALAAWTSITLNFFLPRIMPGDPATAMFVRFKGKLSPDAIAALRETFGFTDGPIFTQYALYLRHLFAGDLGVSVAYFPAPVSTVIAGGLAWTLVLAGLAVVVSFAAGTLLGAMAAWRRGGAIDSWALPVSAFVGAFPYFWLAMLALYIFGFALGWTPLGHAYDDDLLPSARPAFAWSVVTHAALPAATLVAATLGGWMLTMRNTMIGTLFEDYVAMARAKGLSDRRIMLRYAARNALLPNLTGFGMALGFVLSGSLLTEIVFSYPGQGYLLLQAVRSQDYPLMQGVFLTITLAVLAANALVDVAIVILDPRTRARSVAA
jgi:peptide/nickel transport system permease protein